MSAIKLVVDSCKILAAMGYAYQDDPSEPLTLHHLALNLEQIIIHCFRTNHIQLEQFGIYLMYNLHKPSQMVEQLRIGMGIADIG